MTCHKQKATTKGNTMNNKMMLLSFFWILWFALKSVLFFFFFSGTKWESIEHYSHMNDRETPNSIFSE